MTNISEMICLDALEIGRRTADQIGECPPTLYPIRAGRPDFAHGVALEHPSDLFRVADEIGAGSCVLVWSHSVIDADDPTTRLIRLYSGLIDSKHRVLKGAKRQRWQDETEWTTPSVLDGPLPLGPATWVM